MEKLRKEHGVVSRQGKVGGKQRKGLKVDKGGFYIKRKTCQRKGVGLYDLDHRQHGLLTS